MRCEVQDSRPVERKGWQGSSARCTEAWCGCWGKMKSFLVGQHAAPQWARGCVCTAGWGLVWQRHPCKVVQNTHHRAGFEMRIASLQSHALFSLTHMNCAIQPVCLGPGIQMVGPSVITISASATALSSRLQFRTEPKGLISQNILRGCESWLSDFPTGSGCLNNRWKEMIEIWWWRKEGWPLQALGILCFTLPHPQAAPGILPSVRYWELLGVVLLHCRSRCVD